MVNGLANWPQTSTKGQIYICPSFYYLMRWKDNEINYLKEKYPTKIDVEEIINHLNKTRKAIRHKAARLGLSRPNIPHNKPKNLEYRNIIDKRYYENNKEKIYRNKRARLRNRKLELIKHLGGRCEVCGYNRCAWAFDFHHKDGNKENNVARIIHEGSKDKALKEAEKCILLCANCHRELHYKQRKGV